MDSLKNNKVIAIILSSILIFTFVGFSNSYAGNVKEEKAKLNKVNTDLKNVKEKLKAGKKKEADISNKISALKHDIEVAEKELEEIKKSVEETKVKVNSVTKELKEAQADVDSQDRNLSSRFRNMYKNGFIGFLDILLGSNDVEDIVSNVDMVQKIYDNDKDVLKELKLKHEMIAEKKRELKVLQDSLAKKEANEKNKKNNLTKKKEDYTKLEAKVQADNQALNDHATALEKDSARISALINQASSSSKYSDIKLVGNGKFQWPLIGYSRISSYHGYRTHPTTKVKGSFHRGIDIPADEGTPVRAASDGLVIKSGWGRSYGNLVVILHDKEKKLATAYAHNSKLLVKEGDIVKRGQVISKIGHTGRVYGNPGNHLHFEVRLEVNKKNPSAKENFRNPLDYVRP